MLYYSDAAIKYAVDKCLEKNNYKVIIATTRKPYTVEKLLQMAKDVAVFKNTTTESLVAFNNGSSIKCIRISTSCRGNAANLLIVDEDINDDILRNVFIPMEKLDWIQRRQRLESRRADPLN